MTRDKTVMLEKEVLHLKQLIGELKRTDIDGTAGEGYHLVPSFLPSFIIILRLHPLFLPIP